MFRTPLTRSHIVVLLASATSAFACSDRPAGDTLERETLPSRPDGPNDDSSQSEADASAERLFLVAGYLTTADEWVGYLAVVDDLSADGKVDLANAVEFPDDMSFGSPGPGQVYVGLGGSPVIQRWVLDEDNRLALDDELTLANYGVTSALGIKNPFHFIDDRKAYFFDDDTLQVIEWDPQTMEPDEAISIEGLASEDLWEGTNFVHRDGDRLLLTARYWRADDSAALLTKVAILDTNTHEVAYATDKRCGNVSFSAEDSEGNMYFASHTYQVGALAVGAAGDPPAASCIIRILAGESKFDPDYYVDLSELSGGHAGAIVQGPGDDAFVLVYNGPTLTLDTYASAQRGPYWEYYALRLGDEADTFRKVTNVEAGAGYALAFTLESESGESVPYIISVDGDFSEGTYYKVTDADSFEQGLTLPGFPGNAVVIR